MKSIAIFLCLFFILSCTNAKEKKYTGSTPAGPVVRAFLGISLADSIDFIRWNLSVNNNQYHLRCSYGVSKPNTNGFINEIKTELNGEVNQKGNYYQLKNGNKLLSIAIINDDLIHLTDKENHLLVGNGGWSYNLNNLIPSHTDQVNITTATTLFRDSVVLDGRSPCGVPGIVEAGKECYKLKWRITLYPSAGNNKPGMYKIWGTAWRDRISLQGNWTITRKNDRIIYQLNNADGKGFIYLLKADENIVFFTDEKGKLLTGDEDFSYTLNRH